MTRSRPIATVCLLFVLATTAGALGFESISLSFAEQWTGNGYVPTPQNPGGTYDFSDVTGSESFPLNAFLGAGVRIGLLDGFAGERSVLSVLPGLELGVRPYVLFESGIVVPTPIETGTGAEGNTLGRGSAQVLTVRIPLPVAYEIRFENASAVYMSLSPTILARFRVRQLAIRDESTDLSGMYTYFYQGMRFLRPELSLGYRFAVSDWLESTVQLTYGVSLLDLFDSTLPWYDQNEVRLSIALGATPPFTGLFRDREETQELPRGVDPDPDV